MIFPPPPQFFKIGTVYSVAKFKNYVLRKLFFFFFFHVLSQGLFFFQVSILVHSYGNYLQFTQIVLGSTELFKSITTYLKE